MNFHTAIHPFQMTAAYPKSGNFFASLDNRKALLNATRGQIKSEVGDCIISSERGNKHILYYQIPRDNFLADLQEYATSLDHTNLEHVYMGMEQTCFNHLVEIRNNIGIYLPIFFMFPLQISIKQNALPIFVGSAVKLQSELNEIKKSLNPHDKVKLGDIQNNFEPTEEDMEDYEASHEGTDNFWACFGYIIFEKLVQMSIQSQLPIFVF